MANPEHLKILKQGVEAWNRWREENPETVPDISGAQLLHATLEKINLSGAKLKDVHFGAANLWQARLDSADLSGADLWRANFGGCSLCEADLSGAALVLANFHGADLSGAKLDGSHLNRTVLVDVDLRAVKGLEAVDHWGPSEISFSSLQKSQGNIPPAFLRGVGISEEIIQYTQGFFEVAIQFYSCFISYSHSDKSFARRLHDHLQARGIRCWLDEHDLKLGDRILDVVNDAIRLHDKILLCCSEASLNSWWVKDEIRKAQVRERKEDRLIIIPLNLDDYLFEWKDGLESDLTSRLAADFTGWECDNAKFEEQFERVVKALRT